MANRHKAFKELFCAELYDEDLLQRDIEAIIDEANEIRHDSEIASSAIYVILRNLLFAGSLCKKWSKTNLLEEEERHYFSGRFMAIENLYYILYYKLMNLERLPASPPTRSEIYTDDIELANILSNMGRETHIIDNESTAKFGDKLSDQEEESLRREREEREKNLQLSNVPYHHQLWTDDKDLAATLFQMGKSIPIYINPDS